MTWWICPDASLDTYSSPPLSQEQVSQSAFGGRLYAGGDDFDIATGNESHKSVDQHYCTPDFPGGQENIQQLMGTGGGSWSQKRVFEKLADGEGKTIGLRIRISHQMPGGPFGHLKMPVKAVHWYRPWGGFPILKEYYSTPIFIKDEFAPLYLRSHVIVPVRLENKAWRDSPGSWQYMFNVSVSVDVTGGSLSAQQVEAFGESLSQIKYMFLNQVPAPGAPVSGVVTDGKMSAWRPVSSPLIALVIWVPQTIYKPDGETPYPQRLFFDSTPRLIIDLYSFRLERVAV